VRADDRFHVEPRKVGVGGSDMEEPTEVMITGSARSRGTSEHGQVEPRE